MKEDSWSGRLSEGRIVEYAYKELSNGVVALSAKVDGQLTMVVQRNIGTPVTRKQVEAVIEQNFRMAQLAN
jgi:hypothetical protein